jgi:LPS-assembly protein
LHFVLNWLTALVLLVAAAAAAQAQAPSQGELAPPAPPGSIARDHWNIQFETQDAAGDVYTWTGNPVQFEDTSRLFRADFVRYNRDTGDLEARGNVYFRDFGRNEQIWCERLEYNTEDEKGRFYGVRGETMPRILARPGVLTVNAPFHFEGEWAERFGTRYVLHNGWVTNCKLPKPWWRLRGPKFDIVPGERVKAYRSRFFVRRMPLFYAPYFYHSLEKEPRKSGFLTPSPGHSSLGGFMIGLGYFWAINRSNDLTYRMVDYVSRGYAHHLDFRGQPRAGTDYDIIAYGVQDRGAPNSGNPPVKYGGLSLYGVGRSDLGHGWTARASVNYITSFRFRQAWTQSFNEAIGSEVHSTGFINRDWSTYTFDVVFARLENFQRGEVEAPDSTPQNRHYLTDAVIIRKLPEAEFGSRDRALWKGVPLWFSFDSSAGLVSREEPFFNGNILVDHFQTGLSASRADLSPHLTSAIHLPLVDLVPSIGFRETFYSEARAPYLDRFRLTGTNIVRSAREFSLDMVLPSLARVYAKKTMFGDKLKHVIEPRVTYRYVTGVGDDFNRYIRFDERDLLTNTNELELSVANRVYARRGDAVEEIFTWELFQKRFFDPTFGGALVPGQRNVFESTAELSGYAFLLGPRSASPIVSLLRISPIGGIGLSWQADFDPRTRSIVDSRFAIDFRWRKYFLSAGNNEVHTDPLLTPPANQYFGRAGIGDPNHRGWNAAIDAIYDYRKGNLQYTTTQVTYNTDCCGLSVQWHRFLRYNVAGGVNENQFRIAFAIGNIGTFGTMRKQDRLF